MKGRRLASRTCTWARGWRASTPRRCLGDLLFPSKTRRQCHPSSLDLVFRGSLVGLVAQWRGGASELSSNDAFLLLTWHMALLLSGYLTVVCLR